MDSAQSLVQIHGEIDAHPLELARRCFNSLCWQRESSWEAYRVGIEAIERQPCANSPDNLLDARRILASAGAELLAANLESIGEGRGPWR